MSLASYHCSTLRLVPSHSLQDALSGFNRGVARHEYYTLNPSHERTIFLFFFLLSNPQAAHFP